MVFFGRREDAVKKQGQQQRANPHKQQQNKNNKKGIFAGKKGKGEVVPADDRWTLDFKKEYLDDLKRQAEESSRILERERAELARITALNRGSAHAESSGYDTTDAQNTRSPKPPQLHVPDPSGADPHGRHQRAGPSSDTVYNESEIPGLGGVPAGPSHVHGQQQLERAHKPHPPPKEASAFSKHKRGPGEHEQKEPDRRRNKERGRGGDAREGPPPPEYAPQEGYVTSYAMPPYAQPGPPPHMMAMMPPPPFYGGAPSPSGMVPPGMPPPGQYGAQMYAPYPDMPPPYLMPPGYMGSPTGQGGPSNHSFYPMDAPPRMVGQYSQDDGYRGEHRHQEHHHYPPEGPTSPWDKMGKHNRNQEEGRSRHFMSGVANLYGGMDESERRRKQDAQSAYVQELNEQVRQKKEAAEREKRQAREEEVRKDAEIARYVAAEAAPGAPHHGQFPGEKFRPPAHASPPSREREALQEGMDSPMVGRIGGHQLPRQAEAAGRQAHHEQNPPLQHGEAKPRGRRVVNELRAGLSEEQQHRAAAQNDELKREWEKQREEKAAAKEREKAARRAEEEREEAEIRAYHAKLAKEREAEELQRQQKIAKEEANAVRTPPRHGRRASPPPEVMMEALSAEQHVRVSGRANVRVAPQPAVVHNDADIPGLDGDGGGAQRAFSPQHAWGDKEVDGGDDRDWQPQRRRGVPSGRWGEAGAAPQDSEQVSSILRELREEQVMLREQVAKQVETMEALKEQAQAAQVERQRARVELEAVRGRMRSGGPGSSDALDHFIVETHILPKHVNLIPEDLENVPGLELPATSSHHPRAGRPHTPDRTGAHHALAARHQEANRNRAMAIGSPAIIRGDLPSRAPPAASRLGGKISGEPANKSKQENRARRNVDKPKAGGGRWK